MLILDSICTNDRIITAVKLTKTFLQLLQIIVPIALIVLGSLDLGKAVVSLDEGAAKKGQKKFVNRCIAAVLVFLSALIVRTAMGFVGNDAWQACWDATSTVKSVACNYSGTSATVKITYENNKISYSTTLCSEASGLSSGSFSGGCPSRLYYKVDNVGAISGTHCTFTTTKQASTTGYSVLNLQK